MKKATTVLVALAALLLASPSALAQFDNGYMAYPDDLQSKNSPAGTVVEPGSQLIYLLDTGVNAKELFGSDSDFDQKSVYDLSGGQINKAAFQNWLSVTNTNPTQAVTVHFRYIASYRVQLSNGSYQTFCEDVLDFLVVLTCNDTMLIDPFDYKIPGTTLNVKTRFFGPKSSGGVLQGLEANKFDDGRFFLFVTSSGAIIDNDKHNEDVGDYHADWLFPAELVDEDTWDHCLDYRDLEEGSDARDDALDIYMKYVGINKGIKNTNLHILNAMAISFDFLTGFNAVVIPPGLAGVPADAASAAYAVTAWARPSVILGAADDNPSWFTMWPDGDGQQVQRYWVLSGNEWVWLQNDIPSIDNGSTPTVNVNYIVNPFYLRQDAHNGDTNIAGAVRRSNGGALGWALWPIEGEIGGVPAELQSLYMVSMVDDYNGSHNVKKGGSGSLVVPWNDNSYGIDGAETVYDLEIFNNDEELLEPPTEDSPISPPPPIKQIGTRIYVYCIDAFDSDPNLAGSKDYGEFSIADLFDRVGVEAQQFLAKPVPVNGPEHGPGWIRFVHIQSQEVEAPKLGDPDDENATFLLIEQTITRVGGFGVSIWAPTVASQFVPAAN